MKKSIFKDWSICYWVDYSKRDDCLEVVEITQEQYLEETRPVVVEEPVIQEETPVDTDTENEETSEES